MKDDFAALLKTDSYLDWLGDNPARAIRDEIERILRKQVPTAKLKWIHITGEPEFLTGGRELFNDDSKIILTRAAIALPFRLQVDSKDKEETLIGVFSWVATGLDKERNHRVFLDLNMGISEAAQLLKMRIYESDSTSVVESTPMESINQKKWWKFW